MNPAKVSYTALASQALAQFTQQCADNARLDDSSQLLAGTGGQLNQVTIFHAAVPPSAAPDTLVTTVFARLLGACGDDPADHALITLTALGICRRYEQCTGHCTSRSTSHRLLVAALLVAAKTLSDTPVSAAAFSFASGLGLQDILRLEAGLLVAIEYRVPLTLDAIVTVGEADAADTSSDAPPSARSVSVATADDAEPQFVDGNASVAS